MSHAALLHVTCPDAEAALLLARTLVEDRLVAAANLVPGLRSVYRWQGELRVSEEALLLLKTRSTMVEAVTRRVQELHPYELPAIIAVPIEAGSEAYLAWIADETSGLSPQS